MPRLIAPELISGFCSMKRLGVFLLPLDGMVAHRRSFPRNLIGFPQQFTGTHLYSWVERGTVRVKCLAQEHNSVSPARARNRTARSGNERTNHEASRLQVLQKTEWYQLSSSKVTLFIFRPCQIRKDVTHPKRFFPLVAWEITPCYFSFLVLVWSWSQDRETKHLSHDWLIERLFLDEKYVWKLFRTKCFGF